MNKSIRAQKLFIRLSTNQRKRWMAMPGPRRRKHSWGKKFPVPNRVKIEIINAVTGEKTIAYALEDSKRALKKWLRIRNVRAQFEGMVLNPKSSWFNFKPEEWLDFPIIVKVSDDYEVPYVISHIGEKITIKNKIITSLYLRTVDNIDYLGIVSSKKKLMKKWIEDHPIKTKKKVRKKRRFDFDDE